jgi:hypothetical protein
MITIDPHTTALVPIDLQNGILSRKLEPISAADLVERSKAMRRIFPRIARITDSDALAFSAA